MIFIFTDCPFSPSNLIIFHSHSSSSSDSQPSLDRCDWYHVSCLQHHTYLLLLKKWLHLQFFLYYFTVIILLPLTAASQLNVEVSQRPPALETMPPILRPVGPDSTWRLQRPPSLLTRIRGLKRAQNCLTRIKTYKDQNLHWLLVLQKRIWHVSLQRGSAWWSGQQILVTSPHRARPLSLTWPLSAVISSLMWSSPLTRIKIYTDSWFSRKGYDMSASRGEALDGAANRS